MHLAVNSTIGDNKWEFGNFNPQHNLEKLQTLRHFPGLERVRLFDVWQSAEKGMQKKEKQA
jgi:hypothetical protein